MNKNLSHLILSLLLFSSSAVAQTVTGSGTSNRIPLFTGTSTLGDSPIYVNGNNLSLGFSSPAIKPLTVYGDIGIVYGNGLSFTATGGSTYLADHAISNYWDGAADHLLIQPSGSTGGGVISFHTIGVAATRTEAMRISASGAVGIGTSSPNSRLEVNGNMTFTSGSGASLTFADGTVQSTAWTGVLSGGDYAESVDITRGREAFEPGDLIVIDPSQSGRFLKSATPYSRLVSGVYATKPGVVGRRQPRSKSSEDEIPMAMVGIVPTKVSAENGPIQRGDLLVSSATPGYAMKGTDDHKLTGAVLGKALGVLQSGTGVIEVLISLQ